MIRAAAPRTAGFAFPHVTSAKSPNHGEQVGTHAAATPLPEAAPLSRKSDLAIFRKHDDRHSVMNLRGNHHMAHQDKPLPEYRKHDSRYAAVVTIDGVDFELGKYGSVVSRNRYDRLVTEWVANGRALPSALANKTLTVKKLVTAFRGFAKQYYRGSTEVVNLEHSMKPLVDLYGSLPASDFGPLKLKAVRQKMIEADICRAEINKRMGRIKRIFRWATENELLSPTVFHGLQSVRGLARGRTEARESEPLRPAPDVFVDALKPHLPPQIWAMIELQRLTGMRPGEVTIMRTCDLDTSGRVWVYIPSHHKTAYHGHSRQIYLGSRAQEVLRSWLRTETTAYFSQRM